MARRSRTYRPPTVKIPARNLRKGMFVTGHGLVVTTPTYRVVEPSVSAQEGPVHTQVALRPERAVVAVRFPTRSMTVDAGHVFAVHAEET